MKRIFILLTVVCVTAVSCREFSAPSRPTIDYVISLAADSLGSAFSLVKSHNPASSEGAIAIFGEREESLLLAEMFLTADRRDNISGSRSSDMLPDFAGEVLSVILDEAEEPYARLIEDGESERLREIAVRGAIFALDTVCCVTPFNPEATAPKPTSKIIVLSSSLMGEYGLFDIDTLFCLAGTRIPVISPVESMIGEALSIDKEDLGVGVWADSALVASNAYQNVFARMAKAAGKGASAFYPLSPVGEGDIRERLLSWLDAYSEICGGRQLDALLIDDYGVNIEALEAELADIRKEDSFQKLTYARLLSKDFRFIDVMESLTGRCYDILRKENLFTHNISYPYITLYQSAAAPDGSGNLLLRLSSRFISDETAQFIDANVVSTKPLYVQN